MSGGAGSGLAALAIGPAVPISPNPWSDLQQMLGYQFMRNAFAAGAVVAVVAAVVGYFVVLRRSSFAAHALAHVGFAGAAGAAVLGVNPVWGLLVFCLTASGVMGGLGQRLRARDTAIGIVLAFTLGLGVLFISLYSGYATEAYSILFGEILGISSGDVRLTLVIGAVTLALMAIIFRPLLFASVDESVAEARRVPVRALSVLFLMILALAVAVSVQVVGVLLIFALIVTPAAVAERVARSPGQALLVGAGVALLSTWLGLAIGFYFPYPVSFFITSISFAAYLLVLLAGYRPAGASRSTGQRSAGAAAPAVRLPAG